MSYKVRFKFRDDPDDKIFNIGGILWNEKISDLIQKVKKKMATRLEEESAEDIKLYLDDPRGVEREMKLEEQFSKNLDAERVENALFLVFIIKKKTKE